MTTLVQSTPNHAMLLRRAMQLDAVTIVVSCVAAVGAATQIEAATGIPATLLQPLGAVFLVYAAGLAYASTRPTINRGLAWGVTSLNFAWVAASIAALIFGWLPLTPAGFWVVVAQALVVDLLGVAQFFGLRRSR